MMNAPIYRIWPGYMRSAQAHASWAGHSVTDRPMVRPADPADKRSRELACTAAHANVIRSMLANGDERCVVIEDDAILVEDSWLHFTDFDLFIPFANNRAVLPFSPTVVPFVHRFGAFAYLCSRRFAQAYLPLLEAGGISDIVNFDAAAGLRSGAFAGNAVNHDYLCPSLICEKRRLWHLRRRAATP